MMRRWQVRFIAGLLVFSAGGVPGARADETAAGQDAAVQAGQVDPDAQAIIDQQLESLKQQEAARFPCSLFPQADIDALLGNALGQGSYAFNHRFESDRQYDSESCSWSPLQGEGNEASLWVSLPKHFDTGQVACSPGSANREIAGVGDRAWWEYQKFFGLGTLRVCTAKAMLEVKVDLTGNDEAAARKIAQTMADRVMASQ